VSAQLQTSEPPQEANTSDKAAKLKIIFFINKFFQIVR
jgi:hypothetical protein